MPNKDNHLIEESILPTTQNQRTLGSMGYTYIWICMAVIVATFSLGAAGISGLNLATVAMIIFLANLTLGLVMLLTADIGTEHGLSFAAFLRAPFGTFGTHLPALMRGVVASGWFGVQTYLGALALNGIFSYLTGFDNWIAWYVIFAILQITNTAMGFQAVEKLARYSAPAILIVSIWMYYTVEGIAQVKGINIWTFAGSQDIDMAILFVANMSWWSTLAVDIPNITRYLKTTPGEKKFLKRNKNTLIAQFIALPVTQAWIAVIGAVSFIAAGDWNPVNVIQENGTGLTLIILLVLVTLAQWSTNTTANLIPAALTFINALAPRLNYVGGIILAGMVGTLLMPWNLLNELFTFLGLAGSALSAVGGIMICDYFVIRKRQLNVPDLYNEDGQYKYFKGVNPAGIIALIVGAGFALNNLNYAYVYGFPIAGIVYYVLMKIWILKIYPQAEFDNPSQEKYLATSVGKSWNYSCGKFKRK